MANDQTCAICHETTRYGMCACARSEPEEGMGPQGEEWLEVCNLRQEIRLEREAECREALKGKEGVDY